LPLLACRTCYAVFKTAVTLCRRDGRGRRLAVKSGYREKLDQFVPEFTLLFQKVVFRWSMFCINRKYFAVDVGGGSIHLVHRVVYDILKASPDSFPGGAEVVRLFGSRYPVSLIQDACSDIQDLIAAGALYTPEIATNEIHPKLEQHNGLKALCLHVAHDCNLRCAYCFAGTGDYHSGRRLMSSATAIRALQFLIDHSGERRNIEVDFFGGEPLLNFETIKQAVLYGREAEAKTGKRIHFTVTTNGILLDEVKQEFINRYIDNVVISIDGRKEVHDAVRSGPGGDESYERIVPQALNLIRKRGDKEYYIRGTFTAQNLDFSRDVLHLADLGFREISIEPAVGKVGGYTITREHLPTILAEYERLAGVYLDRLRQGGPFHFYHFKLNLYEGPCIYKRISACGTRFEYLAVAPDGEFYPCHQFVGRSEFSLGNLERGLTNSGLMERFRHSNILTKESCRTCWAKFYCSGGCHANSYFSNGDLGIPDELTCEMQRKRIECAIMLETVQKLERESAVSA
jgi:uncharacterized protein